MLPHFSLIVDNASAEYRGSSYSAFAACFAMILGHLSAKTEGSCLTIAGSMTMHEARFSGGLC
jgi:hypothetical protein